MNQAIRVNASSPAGAPHLDAFLQGSVIAEDNGMDLSVLSALARLGRDPWAEAARLAALPRPAAVASLARTILDLPALDCQPQTAQATAQAAAERLVPFLHRRLPAPVQADAPRQFAKWDRQATVLLVGCTLGIVMVMGILIGSVQQQPRRAPSVPSDTAAAGDAARQ